MRRLLVTILFSSAFALVLASCGGDSSTGPDPQKPTTGTMEVAVNTTGTDFVYNNSGDYTLKFDSSDSTTTDDLADTVYVSDLQEGPHEVEVSGTAFNCSLKGNNPQSTNVVAGDTSRVDLTVECRPVANDEIAFVSDRDGGDLDIYLMSSDGSNVERLTNDSALDTDPAISHDGQKIAFVSDRNGYSNLYIMDAAGDNVTQITNSNYETAHPSWSPDDSKLTFADNREGNFEIYTISKDGSNITRLTDDKAKDEYPSWSPDGQKIAFQTNRIVGQNDIYIMSSDGKYKERLTASGNEYEYEPRWSRNGDRVAFSKLIKGATSADSDLEIWTISRTGGGPQQLTYNQNNYADEYPSYGPYNKKIAFASNRTGNAEIFKIAKDGSDSATQLTQNNAFDAKPFWSPSFPVAGPNPFK